MRIVSGNPKADLSVVAALASASDRHDGDLGEEISILRQLGWLSACLPKAFGGEGWGTEPEGTRAAFDALRQLGRANLSLARLFEGHMNAVKLLALYAPNSLQTEIFAEMRDQLLLGVWGADHPQSPVGMESVGGHLLLSGVKRFTSGLGLVQKAVVTVSTERGMCLVLAPTEEPSRADPTSWRMGGMRATRSGGYDFSRVEVPLENSFGAPAEYHREPYFEGGIWRYCATHLGAAEALYALSRDALIEMARADDPHQQRRIVESAIAIETMRMWVLRAATAVEAENALPDKAVLSLLAREVTEHNCLLVMDRAERTLGTRAYVEGSDFERICRDLRLFIRQASPDGKRAASARHLVDGAMLVEEL